MAARTKVAAAVLPLLALLACSGEDNGDSSKRSAALLEPPPKGEGVQLKMTSSLAAGTETERCMFYQVGPEGLAVNHEDVRFTSGSHHILLFVTPYTAIPTQDRFGNSVDTSGIFECGSRGPTAHWEVTGVAGGSQIADGAPIINDLPAGTAIVIPPGTVLLMNTHYLNSTGKEMETDARINLHTIPAAEVTTEAGILFWYNPNIYIPAQQSASAREVCPIRKDIQLVNAQSHMHRRGVGYVARLLDASDAPLSELYRTTEWEEVEMDTFEPPMALTAGQKVDFQCDYQNTTDHTIFQGLSTKDEMCMFLGLYYPKDRQTELCGLNAEWKGAFWGATWIGQGAADGATTAACLGAAKDRSEDGGESFFKCVFDSCPTINTQLSAAVRCLGTQGLGACGPQCSTDAASCKACIQTQCAESVSTLSKATCT